MRPDPQSGRTNRLETPRNNATTPFRGGCIVALRPPTARSRDRNRVEMISGCAHWLHHQVPSQAVRPKIRELIEALARDAVAREERRAQECAEKDQTEKQ
jgi:hypothetical protein